jgi:hypothetical protein
MAIVVAAIACFLLEAGWYGYFLQTWLNGIGRTMDWLESTKSYNPAVQYGIALVMAALMATAISCLTQLTGRQTLFRGVKVGFLLWAGFELTILSTENVFEGRPFSLLLVNAGYWLFAMTLMGAIVGAWKKKA